MAKSKPLKVDGQNVVFEVTLRSSEEDFLNLINNDAAFSKIKSQFPVAEDNKMPPPNDAIRNVSMLAEKTNSGNIPVKHSSVFRYELTK